MKVYQSKVDPLWSTRYADLVTDARRTYHRIDRQTRRRPYVRSAYFKKEKIFGELFWARLNQKLPSDRRRRLRYFPCGLELIRQSRYAPTTHKNPNRRSELLHRFAGVTSNGELFFVQLKEATKTKQKHFMSVFSPH